MKGLLWQAEADLSAANTLRLPSLARVLAVASSDAAVEEVFARADALKLPVIVLGGGSNVVLAPRIEAVVLQLSSAPPPPNPAPGEIELAAGCGWDAAVRACAGSGLWGIENLALVPGRAGAAPVQNIGAYGQELADSLVSVRALDRRRGVFMELSAAECAFGYRDSRFRRDADGWLITRLTLALAQNGEALIDYPVLRQATADRQPDHPMEMVQLVSAIRRSRLPDPARMPNAGSFFKNPVIDAQRWAQLQAQEPQCPGRALDDGVEGAGVGDVKIPAAWLIEHAGWKGRGSGGVAVSDTHALVIVHQGGADGRSVLALAEQIRASVAERFGILLEQEPVALGWETPVA